MNKLISDLICSNLIVQDMHMPFHIIVSCIYNVNIACHSLAYISVNAGSYSDNFLRTIIWFCTFRQTVWLSDVSVTHIFWVVFYRIKLRKTHFSHLYNSVQFVVLGSKYAQTKHWRPKYGKFCISLILTQLGSKYCAYIYCL